MADENVVNTDANVVNSDVNVNNNQEVSNDVIKPTNAVDEGEMAVSDEVFSLLSAFASDQNELKEQADYRNDPEYQRYLEWKKQQEAGVGSRNTESIDFSKVISDPKEFQNFVNKWDTDIQARLMSFTNQILEMAEIMYHLKALEEKYPEISESPKALQMAILKAKSLGLSPREVAEKAVADYISAYRIRQSILKNKKVVNLSNEQLPIQGKSSVRETSEPEEVNPFDFILKAFKSE